MILEGVVLGSRGFGREVLHPGHPLRLHFGLKSSKGINYGSTICSFCMLPRLTKFRPTKIYINLAKLAMVIAVR